MPFDNFKDFETISEERRKAISKSIRTISVEELKKLGEEIFDSPDHPWRETFYRLISENSGDTFYYADAGEKVIFLYCHGQDKGLWCLPKSGMGPLSVKGRQIMKEAIKQSH
jgi:hypothetical protein